MTAARWAPWFAVGVLALAAAPALRAEPMATVARARVEASIPAGLAIADVHLTARLAAVDVDPALVTITWTRAPRVGTTSVRLSWGRQTRFVSVTLAAAHPAPAVDAPAPVGPVATPLPRGTAVTIEVRSGTVLITGHGTLERDARPGGVALVRFQPDQPPLRGTLVAADRVVIGEVTP